MNLPVNFWHLKRHVFVSNLTLLQISNSFGNMDPFGTGQTLPPLQLPQTAAPPTTVNPLKKPPKWIRRPVGASFAVSPGSLLFIASSFVVLPTLTFSWLSFTRSSVGSWCLWRTQSRTLSSLSSPLHTLYISARLLQKQPF